MKKVNPVTTALPATPARRAVVASGLVAPRWKRTFLHALTDVASCGNGVNSMHTVKRTLVTLVAVAMVIVPVGMDAAVRVLPVITEESHVRGDRNAEVTMHEWFDYQCPFCRRHEATIRQLLVHYAGKVNVAVHHFPLTSIHPLARTAAIAAECAAEQGELYFWFLHDALFAGELSDKWGTDLSPLFASLDLAGQGLDTAQWQACRDTERTDPLVDAAYHAGLAQGINGTPTTILVNNRTGRFAYVPGAMPYESMQAAIESLLNGGGSLPSEEDAASPPTRTPPPPPSSDDARVTQLQDEIRALKERVAQLERQVVERERALVARTNAALTNKLKGKILLQVEEKGEAWYVDPKKGKRFYLSGGDAAYAALRTFGLGVSNRDLLRIPVGVDERIADTDTDGDGLPDKLESALGTNMNLRDTDGDGYDDRTEVANARNPFGTGAIPIDQGLARRLEGEILLQVEGRGEAWYMHEGKRYYMKDGAQAYQIMRYLSLGITNADLRQIAVGEME